MEFTRENLLRTLEGKNPTEERKKEAAAIATGIENSIKIAQYAEDHFGKDVDEFSKKAMRVTGIEPVKSTKIASSIGGAEDRDFQKIAEAFGEDVAKSIASDVVKVARLLEVTGSTADEIHGSMQLTAAEAVEKRASLANAGYNKEEIERFMRDWI